MQFQLPLTLIGALLLGGAVPTTSAELAEVYFDFDSATIRDDAAQKLADAAEQLTRTGGKKIFLGGFADPRGTAPYNVALSIRRAEAVRDHLITLGVPGDRIVLGVYGEDAPRRDSFALDRRVSIGLTGDPLHEIVDETLAEAIAVLWSEPVTLAELEGRPIPVASSEETPGSPREPDGG